MPHDNPPLVYWDTNVFIAFMKKEPNRLDDIEYMVDKTERGKLIVITSPFTFTEAYKINDKDCHEYIEDVRKFFNHDYRRITVMDGSSGFMTQKLRNTQNNITWQDSIHVATALLNNVDFMLTYDGENPKHEDPLLALHDRLSFISDETRKLQIITPKDYVIWMRQKEENEKEEREKIKRQKEIEKNEQKEQKRGQTSLFERSQSDEVE